MSHWLIPCLLLAEAERADQFVKGFREGTLHRAVEYNWLLISAIGLGAAVLCYAVERFVRTQPLGPVSNARRLFHDLCRLHRLDRVSIRLLEQIARRAKLPCVAEVFLKPELFRGVGTGFDREQPLLDQLRDQLFAVDTAKQPH